MTTFTPESSANVPATATAATTTGFQGADVDGLDRLASEFTQAAQVVGEVKAACEMIVAVASMFGPFAAAFIAYLKGTVIPWLAKIAEALTAMAKVLSVHSQAQKTASSSSTSLPSYTSTGTTPTTSTTDAPSITQLFTGALALGTAFLAPGLAAAVALPALLAGTGPATATTEAGGTGEKAEAPERIAPHDYEHSTGSGLMTKETLNEASGKESASFHPTISLGQVDGDVAVTRFKTDNVDVAILQAKGGAAVFGAWNGTDGYQGGVAASGALNVFDIKAHADADLGNGFGVGAANETTLGVKGKIDLVGGYNPATSTLSANAGAEGLLGVENVTTLSATSDWASGKVEVIGQAGLAGAATAGVELSPGHLVIHSAAGAAIGLGGKITESVDVNYGRIGSDLYSGASTLAGEAVTGMTNAEKAFESLSVPSVWPPL